MELADTLVDDFDVIDFLQVLAVRCVELLDVAADGLGGRGKVVMSSDTSVRSRHATAAGRQRGDGGSGVPG